MTSTYPRMYKSTFTLLWSCLRVIPEYSIYYQFVVTLYFVVSAYSRCSELILQFNLIHNNQLLVRRWLFLPFVSTGLVSLAQENIQMVLVFQKTDCAQYILIVGLNALILWILCKRICCEHNFPYSN